MTHNSTSLRQGEGTRGQADKGNEGEPSVSWSPGLPVSLSGRNWLKWLLIGVVIAYTGALILAPLAALLEGAFVGGVGPLLATLGEPDVVSAFGRTLLIAVVVTVIHAVCGTALAAEIMAH
jgi:ABC-type sulfate transport system permease subunit